MFKLALVVITAVFFVNPVKAASDPSIPYLITDTQVNAPGFVAGLIMLAFWMLAVFTALDLW